MIKGTLMKRVKVRNGKLDFSRANGWVYKITRVGRADLFTASKAI